MALTNAERAVLRAASRLIRLTYPSGCPDDVRFLDGVPLKELEVLRAAIEKMELED